MPTAADELLDACVVEALAVFRRCLSDPARSFAAAIEVARLKCTLVRHRKSLLVCGAVAADRGDRPEEFAELPEAAAAESGGDRAAAARFVRDWVEEEAALAELGFTPDGLPDPAVWGEEAVTDPEGLLAQIADGRKPPQSGPLAPRAVCGIR